MSDKAHRPSREKSCLKKKRCAPLLIYIKDKSSSALSFFIPDSIRFHLIWILSAMTDYQGSRSHLHNSLQYAWCSLETSSFLFIHIIWSMITSHDNSWERLAGVPCYCVRSICIRIYYHKNKLPSIMTL